MNLDVLIREALGAELDSIQSLSGGCVGDVRGVVLKDGRRVVAKLDPARHAGLEIEAAMLSDLAERSSLPVPAVLHSTPELLLLDWLPGRTGCAAAAEEQAAELIAALHGQRGPSFGYGYDTRIGGLPQPNPESDRWVPFFAEHRLIAMAREAERAGRLDARLRGQVEGFAERLGGYLEEPEAPALLHGDLWSGNMLSQGSRLTGVLDPAIYYGHPEIELAFTTMFRAFGERFYQRYGELRSELDEGFWAVRCPIYNLYPTLVHVRLFGGSYVDDLRRTLARFA